jgi:hypothetical protein
MAVDRPMGTEPQANINALVGYARKGWVAAHLSP